VQPAKARLPQSLNGAIHETAQGPAG